VRPTLLLCDHAEVAERKLFVNGGGWNVIGPQIPPFGIAIYIEVPWDQTNAKHKLVLELLDIDGEQVEIIGPDGTPQTIPSFELPHFEVGRPAGVKPGTPLGVPVAVNFSPAPPIPPGAQYIFQLSIDGHADENWRLHFTTRPAQPESLAA